MKSDEAVAKREALSLKVQDYLADHDTDLPGAVIEKAVLRGLAPFDRRMNPNRDYFKVCEAIDVEPREFMTDDERTVYEVVKGITGEDAGRKI